MNVYIDSENISPDSFFDVRKYYLSQSIPVLSVKVYNDWTENTSIKWNRLCRSFSIDQVQCAKRKDSVDFSIIIDILDNVHIDDIAHNRIQKILIISGDTDYINLTNRIRRTGRDIEVYSPHYENKLYRQQANIFADNEPLNSVMYSRDDIYHSHHEESDDTESETGSSEGSSRDHGRSQSFAHELLHYYKVRDSIVICFLWHNPKKRPYKKIALEHFLKVSEKLKRRRLITTSLYNELGGHEDIVQIVEDKHSGEEFVEYVGEEVVPIVTNILTIIDDIKTALIYDNYDDSNGVKIKTLLSKISLLLDKNVLKSGDVQLKQIIESTVSFNEFWNANTARLLRVMYKEGNRVFLVNARGEKKLI